MLTEQVTRLGVVGRQQLELHEALSNAAQIDLGMSDVLEDRTPERVAGIVDTLMRGPRRSSYGTQVQIRPKFRF